MAVVWTVITALVVASGSLLVAVAFFVTRSSRVAKVAMKVNIAFVWLAVAALAAQVVLKIAGPDVDVVRGLRSFAIPALAYLLSTVAAILVFGVRERTAGNSGGRTEQALQPDAPELAHNGRE